AGCLSEIAQTPGGGTELNQGTDLEVPVAGSGRRVQRQCVQLPCPGVVTEPALDAADGVAAVDVEALAAHLAGQVPGGFAQLTRLVEAAAVAEHTGECHHAFRLLAPVAELPLHRPSTDEVYHGRVRLSEEVVHLAKFLERVCLPVAGPDLPEGGPRLGQ